MAKKTKALTVKAGTKLVVDTNPDFLYKIKLLDGKEVIIDFNHVAKKKFNDLLLELEKDTKITFKDFFIFEDANIVLPSPDGTFYLNSNTFIDEANVLHEYETGETLTELEGGIQAGKTVAETVAATGGFMSYIPLVGIAGGLSAWGGSNPTTTDTDSTTADNDPPPPDTSIYTNYIKGDNNDNQLILLGGTGELRGTIGNDEIDGFDGDDHIFGDSGNDWLKGGAGNDYIRGEKGEDFLYGNDGDDSLEGNEDNDILYGGDGSDKLDGGGGNDELFGGGGNDELLGSSGHDTLYGNDGDDIIKGGDHNDKLYGGDGDDTLNGGGGMDKLYGDAGDDILDGGAGDDDLSGGGGKDTFIYASNTYSASSFDTDTIFDFQVGVVDSTQSNYNPDADVIDLSVLLIGYIQGTSNITDFIYFNPQSGTLLLKIDANGGNNFNVPDVQILIMHPPQTNLNTMIADGNIVLV